MQRIKISFVLFFVVFLAVYLMLCFAIPGMRIKLDAAPMVYFFKSITHMAFLKAMAALVVAGIIGAIPLVLEKKK